MEQKEQVKRISQMETYLQEASEVLGCLVAPLAQYVAVQDKIKALSQYLGYETWYEDRAAYDAGALPQGLACGVLTEDAIFDLLIDNRQVALQMLEVATRVFRDEVAIPEE